MYTLLGVLLTYSLLTFGGVLRHSWFLLAIFWMTGVAGCFLFHAWRRQRIKVELLVALVAALLLFQFTQAKLAVGLVAAAFAWAAANGDNSGRKTVRFFHFLLFVGLLEALLGLTQFFILPGWIFGYTNPFFRSTGTLINRNHFAGLLEMLIPVPLSLAYVSLRTRAEGARAYLYLLIGALMGVALFLSFSRMGIFSFLLTTLSLVLLLRLRGSERRLAAGLGLSLIGLAVAGAVWIGLDGIAARYSELMSEDGIVREGRIVVFRDTIRMIVANPRGVGVGQYQDRFREYQTYKPEQLFDHAHNDYLESMAEWGTLTGLVFWTIVVFVLMSAIRAFLEPGSSQKTGVLLACIGAVVSILLHSLTDFNLQIPSNAMLFFSFVGIAAAHSLPRLARPSVESEEETRERVRTFVGQIRSNR